MKPMIVEAMPMAGGRAGRLTTDRPNTTPEAAMPESTNPLPSIGGGLVVSISGRKIVESQMPMTPMGTLMRKIQCHEK
ncbi:hypothetical protein D3C72_977730 [compost metagenome]